MTQDTSSPIKITKISLGNREVTPDVPVTVNGQWMRDISVDVQNTSPKNIIQGGIVITYPETTKGDSSAPAVSSVANLGRYPDRIFMRSAGSMSPIPSTVQKTPQISIAPGQILHFTVGAVGDNDQEAVDKLEVKITEVKIGFNAFFFADGSQWVAGDYLVPAPPPHKWKKVTSQEFFGSSSPSH
jgi:hypothetical protein